MPTEQIVVRDARQNNLKGITVEIPHRSLTVVTGPSGSGKSSLAFDTIYAEGQRRYIESLSTYAKQFLERMAKPHVGRLEGIAPSVAIEQKNPTTSSRSTVGTATEIHDFLRLLWARAGTPHCSNCGAVVRLDSPSSATAETMRNLEGEKVSIVFRPHITDPDLMIETLTAMGFVRVAAGDRVMRLEDLGDGDIDDSEDLFVVVDRMSVSARSRTRLSDSLTTAFAECRDLVEVRGSRSLQFSPEYRCTDCGKPGIRLTPGLFSFNNAHGACETCTGFGAVLEYDETLIVPDGRLSLSEGAIDPWTKPRYTGRRRLLRDVCRQRGIDMDTAWDDLNRADADLLLAGKSGRFVGVIPFLKALEKKRYKQYIRVFLRQYQRANECPDCGGTRLKPEALAVTVGGTGIGDVCRMTSSELVEWAMGLELPDHESEIGKPIVDELLARARFLEDVGLGYLTFDRLTRTLSGGEAQRISLANALGANLVDTLYVLDEPTIGLHARDTGRLNALLERLRDAGNTLVVVEHDMDTIRRADWIVELGPASGDQGGELVYGGAPEGIPEDSATGGFLKGSRNVPRPTLRRNTGGKSLTIESASLHNIDDLTLHVPLDCLIAVTGVSGSGKSTLVHDILYRQLAHRIRGAHGAKEHLGERVGAVSDILGWKHFDDVVLIDQTPIGKSPRSNPITYVKGFDDIRALYARQPLSQARGYSPSTFSFNTAGGGRCRVCDGAGYIQVEMVFLADVFVPCDACDGTRYDSAVREVRISSLSISDVLQLTVDEAVLRFRHQEKLGKALWHLQQVGLGYLRLGQPATTLSGGEAQRLKIARQLATVSRGGRRLYILDEPTTGLHSADVLVLGKVLDRLVDAGHTVIVIEHNLDLIKRADWIIDMGPEGGPGGGKVVAEGVPEAVAKSKTHTGRALHSLLSPEPVTS